ncbi:MAG: NADH dehydrogenase [Paraglaciecola sp.]|jgi:NADH dehydrogenase
MSINIPDTKENQKRIVIVGGGFAGLNLAKRMSKTDYQVVLIDKNNYHQFQPLFYQVAMSGLEPSSIVFPLRKMFQKYKNTFIRVAKVEEIDAQKQEINTELGTLEYDYLVLAIGAETNFFGNEHIAEKAIPMKSVSEALYLRNAVLDDFEKALVTTDFETRQKLLDIVIVGGGPTGVEVAGALAEMKKYILPKDYPEMDCDEIDIFLLQGGDALLKGMSENASQSSLKYLQDLGVKVQLNARVTDFDGEFVCVKDGDKIPAKKVIWAAGIIGNKMKGLPDDCRCWGNRFRVNRLNQIQTFDNIYAIGDICYMEEPDYPKGHPQVAQVAIQQGKNLAKNFKLMEKEKSLKEFSYNDLGSMATIGRHLAVVDLPRWKMNGLFAWFIWLFVHLFQLMGVKNRLFVFINWVWNYVTYDQSLRLIIKPKVPKNK